jgi:broad specificity phosphatase PhoE
MPKYRSFFFVRHGQTDWNAKGILQGHNDIPLNQTGKDQAYELAKNVREHKFDVIITSTLSRAFETAEIINQLQSLPIVPRDDLREACSIEAAKYILASKGIKRKINFDFVKPHPEGPKEFIKRIETAIHSVFEEYQSEKLLIVAHGGVLAAMCEIFQHQVIPTPNCQLIFFDWLEEGKYRISHAD